MHSNRNVVFSASSFQGETSWVFGVEQHLLHSKQWLSQYPKEVYVYGFCIVPINSYRPSTRPLLAEHTRKPYTANLHNTIAIGKLR